MFSHFSSQHLYEVIGSRPAVEVLDACLTQHISLDRLYEHVLTKQK